MEPSQSGSKPAEELSYRLGRWGTALLRLLPAETAHHLGLAILRRGWLAHLPQPRIAELLTGSGFKMSVPGLGSLAHPIGLAAGFDKNAVCPNAFKAMGFAFLELGTVTPRAQLGNPRPRLFRQASQRALVNRMGFNNDGGPVVAARLKELAWDHQTVPLGVNTGKNKDTPLEAAAGDYCELVRTFRGLAGYFVVNVSSPNTPGLRGLANRDFLHRLASSLRRECPGELGRTWVKLDPDLTREALQELTAAVASAGFAGLILANTHRVERPEQGGQSGHPLAVISSQCLEWAYEVHRGSLPMIGCGGILSGADILQKIIRGASAVQIYTALVYRGPWVVWELLGELAEELRLRGFTHVQDAWASYYSDRSLARSPQS